jgi:dihydroneopterin aldolase
MPQLMPNDRLTIHHIAFRAPCGVRAEERALGNDFTADVTLVLDLGPAGRSDALKDTVDYGPVAETVVATAAGERHLVEHLAEDIAAAVLATYPVAEVEVALTKTHPPVAAIGGGVTVRIRRAREGAR